MTTGLSEWGEAQFVSDTRVGRAANLLNFHNVVAIIKVLNGSLQCGKLKGSENIGEARR
jgi:hypothetical protein